MTEVGIAIKTSEVRLLTILQL